MKDDFNEIRKAVEVSNNLINIERDLYISFSPLGQYYATYHIDKSEQIRAYDEKMMKLRDEIIKFRNEFEASFLITECEECSQPQQV